MKHFLLFFLCFTFSATLVEAAKVKPITAPKERKPISGKNRKQQIYFFHEGTKRALYGGFRDTRFCFEKALKADPYCDACYYELSSLYIAAQQLPEALILAQNAYLLDSSNFWYQLRCAKLYATVGQLDTAEKYYLNCLAQKPKQQELYQDLLLLYGQQKNHDKMLSLLDDYEQNVGPDEMSLLTRQNLFYKWGNFSKAMEQLHLLIEMFPGNQQYLLLASELHQQQENDTLAYQILMRAKEQDSTSLEYQTALSDYYRRTARYGEYFEVLKSIFDSPATTKATKFAMLEFLQQFPQLVGLFSAEVAVFYDSLRSDTLVDYHLDWMYAQFLLQTDKPKQGVNFIETSLQRALAENKNLAEKPQKNRGENQEDLAILTMTQVLLDFFLVHQQWDSVVDIADKYAGFFAAGYKGQYIKVYALSQKGDYAAAEKAAETLLLDKTIEATDTAFLAQMHATLGDIYFNLGKHAKTDKSYKKALKYTPNNTLLLNNYAYYLSLRGEKLGKALKMSKTVIEQHPENATYLDTYAWILYKQKRYGEAKQIFRRAFVYGGENEPTLLEHYGDVLFELGEKSNAKIYWERSRTKGNKTLELQEKIKTL